jgi:hypothetical protein
MRAEDVKANWRLKSDEANRVFDDYVRRRIVL